MDWTPEEIKKLVKKFGGTAVMAEIMRVTPQTIKNMTCGNKIPSTGAGIALLNLISLLEETMSRDELTHLVEALREKNRCTPIRAMKKR